MNYTPQNIRKVLFDQIEDMQANACLYVSDPSHFTRTRKISFFDTILSTISMQRSADKAEILKYFNFSSNTPTASALIQQRNKIPATTFETLFYSFTNAFSMNKTIKGYDPIAVDGSDIKISRNPQDKETYRITDKYNKGFNMIHLNAAYHLLSHLFIDVIPQPVNQINEYRSICDMIDHYAEKHPERKALFIADRGHAALNVFAHAIENNAFFLIRARDSQGLRPTNLLSTVELPDSPEFDMYYDRLLTRRKTKDITAAPEIYKTIRNRDFDYLPLKSKDTYPIRFRIVRFPLLNNNYETVYTNLPEEDFSVQDLKELYNLRWGIETSFRDIKYAANLLFFHSKKKELIMQEIYAKLILYNYAELITGSIAFDKKDCKYVYQINFSVAIFICTEYLRQFRRKRQIDVITLIQKELIPIRPGRCSPRYIRARTASTFQYR